MYGLSNQPEQVGIRKSRHSPSTLAMAMQGLRLVVKPVWKSIVGGGFTLILLIMRAYFSHKLVWYL